MRATPHPRDTYGCKRRRAGSSHDFPFLIHMRWDPRGREATLTVGRVVAPWRAKQIGPVLRGSSRLLAEHGWLREARARCRLRCRGTLALPGPKAPYVVRISVLKGTPNYVRRQ